MSRRLKTRSGGDLPNGIYWGLALVLLLGVAWIVWKSSAPSKPNPAAVVATNVVHAVSNLPPIRTAAKVATNVVPPAIYPVPDRPDKFPRQARTVFDAQVAMARQAISSGSLDGVFGSQTRAALRAFQRKTGLPETGNLDAETRALLDLSTPLYITYTITTNDLARLQPLSQTWLGKSQQTALEYETILEFVAEMSQSHPGFIRQLNPTLDWSSVTAGTEVKVPDIVYPPPSGKAAFLSIRLSEKTLAAYDDGTNLLAFFPCSIAKKVEKRPVGELHVSVVIPNPDYTFDPDVFPESAEAQELGRKLILPPGPNNPVGVAWIGLDKPGYGIHGTPSPEQVGRTESHGCFRLANWNAAYLVKLVSVGTPVRIEP